jgi:hypothetical protein
MQEFSAEKFHTRHDASPPSVMMQAQIRPPSSQNPSPARPHLGGDAAGGRRGSMQKIGATRFRGVVTMERESTLVTGLVEAPDDLIGYAQPFRIL